MPRMELCSFKVNNIPKMNTQREPVTDSMCTCIVLVDSNVNAATIL